MRNGIPGALNDIQEIIIMNMTTNRLVGAGIALAVVFFALTEPDVTYMRFTLARRKAGEDLSAFLTAMFFVKNCLTKHRKHDTL